jgi:hypothetical protein
MWMMFQYDPTERARCDKSLRELVTAIRSRFTKPGVVVPLLHVQYKGGVSEWDKSTPDGYFLSQYIGGHVSYGRACVKVLTSEEWDIEFLWKLEDTQHREFNYGQDCWIDSRLDRSFRWRKGQPPPTCQ